MSDIRGDVAKAAKDVKAQLAASATHAEDRALGTVEHNIKWVLLAAAVAAFVAAGALYVLVR